MHKKEKRAYISQKIDLSRTRLTDQEADTLYEITKNYDQYKGKSKTYSRSSSGISSDGKYTRNETRTYTFTEDQVGIRYTNSYHDDDGEEGSVTQTHNDGRGILNLLKYLIK